MEEGLRKLIEKLVLFAPKVGVSFLIFFAFWLAGVILQKIISRFGDRTHWGHDILPLLARTAKITIIVFGAITACGTMGIDVSALVAGLGLSGFALGFAFRDALSNILAGIMVLIYHPFRRGDHITTSGFEGVVRDIDLRYTILQAENKTILLPNSTLFTNPIVVQNEKHEVGT